MKLFLHGADTLLCSTIAELCLGNPDIKENLEIHGTLLKSSSKPKWMKSSCPVRLTTQVNSWTKGDDLEQMKAILQSCDTAVFDITKYSKEATVALKGFVDIAH